MNASDFDYHLPADRIAQEPMAPRDASRLLVLERMTGAISHRRFFELGEYLHKGDLLIVNESRVFKARLHADGIEIFLLRADGPYWRALAQPGRKLKIDMILPFSDGTSCRVVAKNHDGTILVDFKRSPEDVLAWTDTVGEVPLPPYIKPPLSTAYCLPPTAYQTIYAQTIGSVAAPTAGFHFTSELIEKLTDQGIRFAAITLHVGLGTFRPIKTKTLEEHAMHEEWIDVPEETQQAIKETKQRGGRIIAVGTTTVRALESGMRHGFTNLFITPGYRFNCVDGLITNFHLPKSTLLVLVSAFAGREMVLKAYSEAIREGYRFYSFGDAMLIV